MESNGQPMTPATNPGNIVAVENFSPQVIRNLIAHLEASTDFEHLVYREAELDAVWSLTGFCLLNEKDPTKRAAVERLHVSAQRAHELVADGRPEVAAEELRNCL